MPVRSECVRRARACFWPVLHVVLVIGLLVVSLTIRYTAKPRSTFYAIFRETSRKNMLLRTLSWPVVRSPHVLLKYRPEDSGVVAMVAQTTEEVYRPVVEMLKFTPPGPVMVVVYPDRQSMGRSFGWKADEGAMGVYWAGVIRVLSPDDWTGATDHGTMASFFRENGPMAHELAHLVVDYRTRGNCPRWLTEGIAQYVEREITGFQFTSPADAGNEEWYPLEKMDGGFDDLPDQGLAYRQSLAMVELMVNKVGFDGVLNILSYLGQDYSLEQAMVKVFGGELFDRLLMPVV